VRRWVKKLSARLRVRAPELRSWLRAATVVVVVGFVLVALHHLTAEVRYRDLVRALHATPAAHLAAAMGLTWAAYLVGSGYDLAAMARLDHRLPRHQVVSAAWIGTALSNNVGYGLLSGGAARYRMFSAWGLSDQVAASSILGSNIGFGVGATTVLGFALIVDPSALRASAALTAAAPIAGVLLILGLVGLAIVSGKDGRRLSLWGHAIALPGRREMVAFAIVGIADWLLAAAVLWVLLPAPLSVSFWQLATVFVVTQLLGVASGVPGGLGVFESAALGLLGGSVPAQALLAALVLYRVVYYLVPLAIAVLAMGAWEASAHRQQLERVAGFGSAISSVVPLTFAVGTAVGGIVLLVSGATPASPGRLTWLHAFVPLPVIEGSHFLASVAGALMLLQARALGRRLRIAYYLSLGWIGVGIVASLAKGFDYEETILLALLAAALAAAGPQFYRRSAHLASPSAYTIVSALAFIVGAAGVARFAFRHVDLQNELFWQFELHAEAARSLRAQVGAAIVVLLGGFAWLLRAARPRPQPATPEQLDRADALLAGVPDAFGHLALVGDKALLFSESGRGLLMYGVLGNTWVALGNGVGPSQEWRELAWRFWDLVDEHGGRIAFSEIGPEMLPVVVELGLTAVKMGEEPIVDLTRFTLSGTHRKGLRASVNRVERTGHQFRVVPPEEIAPLLPELRAVSDAWLALKRTREKGFSLGYFSESYLLRRPLAIVTGPQGIVAFANLWTGAEELSFDLMRYLPDAESGLMDLLIVRLILWGKEHGYRRMSLGMVPLSGLPNRQGAPLWGRLATLVYRHAENFYNFQGLRAYKEKFDPQWEPRYLACAGGAVLPRILVDLAGLSSQSYLGIVSRGNQAGAKTPAPNHDLPDSP